MNENEEIEPLFRFRAIRALRGEAGAHGLAVEALVRLLEQQGCCCAICARLMIDSAPKRAANAEPIEIIEWNPAKAKHLATPHVDFCPETGLIRGVLCGACLKLLAGTTDPYALLEHRLRVIPQPKWVNPKPNRPHRKRKRKAYIMKKDMAYARFIPRERRVRLLDYFARALDESLISAAWQQRRESAPTPFVPEPPAHTDDRE